MDMNIGSLMRALTKDSQPADVKALELRIGQIVRGVLVEILEGQDALMNINGVPVRARLEAPMSVGQSTLLQVRPESASGLISLQPLADATQAGAAAELLGREGVKAFGLPEQAWSRELLRGLSRDGYPVARETADWFKQAAAAMPPGSDAQEWMSAAGVVFRRGLQPTEATIGSLRQALYGAPLHEQLSAMAEQAEAAAANSSAKPEVAEGARRALQLLREVSALIGGAADVEPGDGAAGGGAAAEGAGTGRAVKLDAEAPSLAARGMAEREQAGPGQAPGAAAIRGSEAGRAIGAGGASDAVRGEAAVPGEAPEQAQSVKGAQGQGASAEATARRDIAAAAGPPRDAGTPPRDAMGGAMRASLTEDADAPSAPRRAAGDASGAAAAAAGKPADDAPWIGRLLSALGASHEHIALKSGVWSELQGGAQAPAGPFADGMGAEQTDSLKSALLGLSAMEDAPPSLREAAQNLVQQITGQQLLLSAERQNTAMMSHMTLFVPMKGKDGDTTAKVHIEARRGRRGEWDADNCRLLFDLDMRYMGRTIVDVQVVDKSVSLRLLNDRPEVAELIEGAREEAAEGLGSAGYKLMSLTAAPYPAGTAAEAGAPEASAAPAQGAYAAKPYKGIDYRA
ncbi:hypothetical protein [Cohnella sp. JJ-181]|uniref:hypothetical protein n=1 Tax=Cohnella rhizoplanae TaxID=2974897 RepID=UPI0022FF97FF|nr:hypothetical protein [Cohnella sp. JJ-181]CAI6026261.1 hypothetical protein COHCIP112018_00517 [Cohnella sp. JJ-181]